MVVFVAIKRVQSWQLEVALKFSLVERAALGDQWTTTTSLRLPVVRSATMLSGNLLTKTYILCLIFVFIFQLFASDSVERDSSFQGLSTVPPSSDPLPTLTPADDDDTRPRTQAENHTLPMHLCADFDPKVEHKVRSAKCSNPDESVLTHLPFGDKPAQAELGNDSCAWRFHCRKDVLRSLTTNSAGRALWWEAVLKTPAQNGRKPCQTSRGGGWCVPLKKYEIVVRYATRPSEKSCFYWRKVKTAYYCKADTCVDDKNVKNFIL